MIFTQLREGNSQIACIQIGSGLIGSAITKLLHQNGVLMSQFKTDWKNIDSTLSWIQDLPLSHFDKIEIIWAAGKVGFSANVEETEIEKNNFDRLVEALAQKAKSTSTHPRFWLMSSAGGIFEGKMHINKNTTGESQRPYTSLKLHQEEKSIDCFGLENTVICRISSVYTKSNLSGRLGLIPVLMKNGIQNKLSTIIGDESTLRDYVLDDDIAKFVVQKILNQPALNGIQYLIAGKSESIQSIRNAIERIIIKKLFLQYSLSKANAESISFSKKMVAIGFTNSPMEANLKMLYFNLLSNISL